MQTKVDKMLALATDIAALNQQLEAKREAFRQLAGKAAGWAPRGVSGPRPDGDSIAQQVLKIVAAGPKTRGEIIAAVGGHASAVTSALKKHKATGKLVHADGKYGPPASTTAVTPVQVRKGTSSK